MGDLISILKPDFEYDDERGKLIQLVRNGYKQINVVTSNSGVFRGGHYHKNNTELFYVIYGKFRLIAESNGKKEEYVFSDGDMFLVKPGIVHSFYYEEKSAVVAMYDFGVEMENGQIDSYKV